MTAADATSPVTHAQYSIDAGRWQYVAPVGNIADSPTEQFEFDAPLPAPRADADPPVDRANSDCGPRLRPIRQRGDGESGGAVAV